MFNSLQRDNTMNAGTASDTRFSQNSFGSLASLGFAALLFAAVPAQAAIAPNLGSNQTFGVISDTYTNTAVGTTINGDICYTTGPAIVPTIFPVTLVNPPAACTPQNNIDFDIALSLVNGQPCTDVGPGAIALDSYDSGHGPGIWFPGCYETAGAMNITVGQTVTLNGNGVYIFRSAALNPAANTNFSLLGGACEGNVFWAPTGTTIGANSTFVGTILDAGGITIGDTVTLRGRALVQRLLTVSTDKDTISIPGVCDAPVVDPPGVPPVVPPVAPAVPTMPQWAMIILAALLAAAGFAAMRRRAR